MTSPSWFPVKPPLTTRSGPHANSMLTEGELIHVRSGPICSQSVPFHCVSCHLLKLTPGSWAHPPAISSLPSVTASDVTRLPQAVLHPPPIGCHEVPSQRAMRTAGTPPAVSK